MLNIGKKMKVLSYCWSNSGGILAYNTMLRKYLEKKGHSLTIVSRNEDLGLNFKESLYKTIRISFNKYDLILMHDWSVTFSLIFQGKVKSNFYCIFHGFQTGKGGVLQRMVASYMKDHLFVISPALKKKFPEAVLNLSGTDFDFFKPNGSKRQYLGWFNRQYSETNEKEMLNLCARLKLKPLFLNYSNKISFGKMPEFYNQCKVFVAVPKTAGFNMCWIEAGACGVPYIVGNKQGIGSELLLDSLKDARAGFLCKRDYRKLFLEKGLNFENHVKRLLEEVK